MDLESRFFTEKDKKLKKMDKFVVPDNWLFRHYEYKWASDFLNKNDTILDAACGIEHPFKYYASSRVNKVYACDIDLRLKSLKNTDTLEFKNIDLVDLNKHFEEKYFDKIFCISVLEHVLPKADILKILINFRKLLKDDGLIILTIDHPFLITDNFISYVNQANLQFAGKKDFKIPQNVVKGTYMGLRCYRAVLKKIKKETEERKIIKPDETKPEFPEEIK